MALDIKVPDVINNWRSVSSVKTFSAVLLDTAVATISTFGAQLGPFSIAWYWQLTALPNGWRLLTATWLGVMLATPIAAGVLWKQWAANRNQLDKDLKATFATLSP